jgi:L-arabinose isomerase
VSVRHLLTSYELHLLAQNKSPKTLRAFLEEGGFGAFTDTFEDLGALK